MINNEFVMLILELPNYGHQFLLLYCCQNTKELSLHDEVRSYWGGYLIFLVIYLLSPL